MTRVFERRSLAPALKVASQGFLVSVAFLGMLGACVLPHFLAPAQWPRDSWSGGYTVFMWVGAALAALLSFQSPVDEWMRRHVAAARIIVFLLCLLAVLCALWQNLDARFGPVDDHEIARWLGPDKRTHWREWPSLWWDGEVAEFGATGRYRPGYFGIRIAECCWWGSSVAAWYASRIALCSAWLAFLWLTVRRWWGDTLSFAFVMGVLGLSATADVFCRLGPAESYVLPAIAVGVWALSVAWSPCADAADPRFRTWPWWVASIAFGFAVLCKENAIPWAAVVWLVTLHWLWRTRGTERPASGWMALGFLTLCLCLVSCAILRSVSLRHGDVYGNSVGTAALTGSVEHALAAFFFQGPLLALWPMAAGAAACGVVPWAKLSLRHVCVGTACAIWLWLSQALFYRSAGWPGGTRYDLPAALVPLVLMIAGAAALLTQLRSRSLTSAGVLARASLVAILLLVAGQNIVTNTMSRAMANRAITRGFASWLGDIVKETRANPGAVVLLLPERASEHYEFVVSTMRFLQYQKVSNPIRYSTQYLQAAASPLDEKLAGELLNAPHPTFPPSVGSETPEHAILVPFGAAALATQPGPHQRRMDKSLDQALAPKSLQR